MAAEQSHMSPSVKGGGQRGRESHGELPLRLKVKKGEGGEGGRGRGREREGGEGRGSEGEGGKKGGSLLIDVSYTSMSAIQTATTINSEDEVISLPKQPSFALNKSC